MEFVPEDYVELGRPERNCDPSFIGFYRQCENGDILVCAAVCEHSDCDCC
jgi:hypothetical protein